MADLPLATSADPLTGTPYRMIAPLGRGGMGEVLEAEHVHLEKRVVVKLLHKELADNIDVSGRLRVEARTLAALNHPHLVTVSDFGHTPEGRPYVVMERLYGRTLRQELDARGALPIGEALGYVRQVLSGLAAAHRRGVVHRDIKLENVFICRLDGALVGPALIKVLDFGIAKVLRGSWHGISAPPPTREGLLLGSPRTIAPEQARGLPVDARADLYAVGLLLYTLLAGRGPFDHASTPLEMLQAHIFLPPPPPSALARQPIPLEIDRVILKAIAKRPEDRFWTAEAFEAALERFGQGAPLAIGASPAPLEPEPATWVVAPKPRPRLAPDRRLAVFVLLTLASAAFFFALALYLVGRR